MPTTLIHDDFLLDSEPARRLYHEYAADMPIIDYHCHLPPAEVAQDKRWQNLTQVWLYGDHYKWRQMRTNGIDERFCTGDASDREKFDAWARTVPYLLRNPLYHWTHLELARYFGCTDLLSPKTADRIWEIGRDKLARPEMSARGLMQQSNVVLVCTTDDPIDSLEHHQAVAADKTFDVRVLPTWRPDKALAIDKTAMWNEWLDKLGAAAGVEVSNVDSLLDALARRQQFFHDCGCRLSDHGLETVYAEDYTDAEIRAIFAKARGGKTPDAGEILKFRSAILLELCRMNAKLGWTQQIHYGAMRNNNTRMFQKLGPDTGYDSIGDWPVGQALSKLLDRLEQDGRLTRTILYNLNPRDNALLTTMLGNFQDGSIPGKIQHGSAWWVLDHLDGMTQQIETLSATGLLSRFVGMLTDSRSFLSYTRHEYFRRLLCNILGDDIVRGRIPSDYDLVGGMVKDISYRNAASYFGFDLPAAAAQ